MTSSSYFEFLEDGSLLIAKRAAAASITASMTAIICQLMATELLLVVLVDVIVEVVTDPVPVDVIVVDTVPVEVTVEVDAPTGTRALYAVSLICPSLDRKYEGQPVHLAVS